MSYLRGACCASTVSHAAVSSHGTAGAAQRRRTTYAVQEGISRPRRSIRSKVLQVQAPGLCRGNLKTEGAYHPHCRNQCCKFCHAR